MNIRRAVIAAAGGVAATALVGTLPVGAQEGDLLPISVTPSSGPAGTVVTVSGEDCVSEAGPGDLVVYLFDSTSADPIEVFGGTVTEDGAWTSQLQVEATDPPGVYDFSATCFESPESETIVADYDFASFELTAPAPTGPPAAEPTPPAAPPAAAPATAVPAKPTFTG
jgi:hypothetical protein